MRGTIPAAIAIGIFLALSGGSGIALAHPTGQSLDHISGNYIIDIGYDSITPKPEPGKPVAFNFLFFDNTTKDAADFSDVEISIRKQSGELIYYADAKKFADNSQTNAVSVFPQAGNYRLTASYKQDGRVLASATFPLQAAKPERWTGAMLAAALLTVVAVVGVSLGIAFAWDRYRNARARPAREVKK